MSYKNTGKIIEFHNLGRIKCKGPRERTSDGIARLKFEVAARVGALKASHASALRVLLPKLYCNKINPIKLSIMRGRREGEKSREGGRHGGQRRSHDP